MIYSIGDVVDFSKLHWQSDWTYEEIYGERNDNFTVIGLYSDIKDSDLMYYIDIETGKVIEVLNYGEDDIWC